MFFGRVNWWNQPDNNTAIGTESDGGSTAPKPCRLFLYLDAGIAPRVFYDDAPSIGKRKNHGEHWITFHYSRALGSL